MDFQEKDRLAKNWRGRRLLACRAAEDMQRVINALADDDLSNGAPPAPAPNAAVRNELNNQMASLLRLFLILNDGGVSNQTLHFF